MMRTTIERGKPVGLFALESYDASYMRALGVDIDAVDAYGNPLFEVLHPHSEKQYDSDGTPIVPTAEEWLQLLMEVVKAGYHQLLVIDTIAKLTPRAELEADFDKVVQIGVHAKMMTSLCRRIGPYLQMQQMALVAINQVRVNIGGWAPQGQTPVTSPGGKGFHHESYLRLRTATPIRKFDNDGQLALAEFRFKMEKTKICNASNETHVVEIVRDPDEGIFEINPVREVFEVGKKLGVFTNEAGTAVWNGKGNAFFPILDVETGEIAPRKLANGSENIQKAIASDPALYLAIRAAVVKRMSGKAQREPATESEYGPDAADTGVLPRAQASLGFE